MLPDTRGRTRRFTTPFIHVAAAESRLCGVIHSAVVTMLVVEQPDGTMALVPEWMTTPAVAAAEIREVPCLPHAELRTLRQAADAVLSLPPDRGTEVGMGHYTLPAQRELFPRAAAKTSLPPAVITRLLLLIGRLLAETAAVGACGDGAGR